MIDDLFDQNVAALELEKEAEEAAALLPEEPEEPEEPVDTHTHPGHPGLPRKRNHKEAGDPAPLPLPPLEIPQVTIVEDE